jgi:hypothetical protein
VEIMMKKRIIALFLFLTVSPQVVFANEGMWLPNRVAEYLETMRKMGLTLSKDEIYNTQSASLKDAIVHFGGFCTGEIVSRNGLVFTNHHCGYDAIAGLSTPEKNYLDSGYWASGFNEDLPVKGLFVRILNRIEDVTDRIIYADDKEKAIKQIEQEARGAGNQYAVVTPIYYGNQYLLWVYDEYKDIRFVGTPPAAIGKFGGDTDNWMWPRHTGDFAVFRIYAGPNNEPASFNENNKPFNPKHFLPISLQGLKASDFSMIMGFPGRTSRYLPPAIANFRVNTDYPFRALTYAARINRMKEEMEKNIGVRLMLASAEARLANGEKYFRGVMEAFQDPAVFARIVTMQKNLEQWTKQNPEKGSQYAGIAQKFENLYSDYANALLQDLYLNNTFATVFPIAIGSAFNELHTLLLEKKPNEDAVKKITETLKARLLPAFDRNHSTTNEKLLATLTRIGLQSLSSNQIPDFFNSKTYTSLKGDKPLAFAALLAKESFLMDKTRMEKFLNKPSLKTLEKDPGFLLYLSFRKKRIDVNKSINILQNEESELLKLWMAGLMASQPGVAFYPDANSNLRISFGKTTGYEGPDGKKFHWATFHEGILEKEIPNDEEFHVSTQQKTLLLNRDFGGYGDEKTGRLPVNFLTDHDITGGNSGSPVINAKGHLVGIAFDGNWEGMAGDIVFDDRVKRTINVDIRYVLFVIDKLGGAKSLIQELELIR